MKKGIWAAVWVALLFYSKGWAVPDPLDSIILESKAVAPSDGPAALTVLVSITNKDTLATLNLGLVIRSLSNGAFITLARPRTFAGTINRLTSTLPSFLAFGDHTNSVSPDSAYWVAFYNLLNPAATIELPNSVRKPFWEIKFDTVQLNLGTVELDSTRVVNISTSFTSYSEDFDVPVNFVKSTITVSPSCPTQDLRVAINHFGPATRGSWRCVRIQCRNVGSCNALGTAVLQLPPQADAVFAYDRGYPAAGGAPRSAPVVIDTVLKKITWNVPSLAVGEGLYLWARYKVPCNIGTGTPLVSSVRLEPFAIDTDTTNNIAAVSKPAAAGASPCNALEKPYQAAAALPSAEIFGFGAIDTLTILILFQNTGGGVATNVLARDSLDLNLNTATFDSAGASHSFSLSLSGSELTWDFSGANLPDSVSDPTGSVGFAAFRIRSNTGLPEGTEIQNRAFVSFDGGAFSAASPLEIPVCVLARGDVNGDSSLSAADVVTMLNCAFLNPGGCTACADLNCDGNLSPADVVIELNAVFSGVPISCP